MSEEEYTEKEKYIINEEKTLKTTLEKLNIKIGEAIREEIKKNIGETIKNIGEKKKRKREEEEIKKIVKFTDILNLLGKEHKIEVDGNNSFIKLEPKSIEINVENSSDVGNSIDVYHLYVITITPPSAVKTKKKNSEEPPTSELEVFFTNFLKNHENEKIYENDYYYTKLTDEKEKQKYITADMNKFNLWIDMMSYNVKYSDYYNEWYKFNNTVRREGYKYYYEQIIQFIYDTIFVKIDTDQTNLLKKNFKDKLLETIKYINDNTNFFDNDFRYLFREYYKLYEDASIKNFLNFYEFLFNIKMNHGRTSSYETLLLFKQCPEDNTKKKLFTIIPYNLYGDHKIDNPSPIDTKMKICCFNYPCLTHEQIEEANIEYKKQQEREEEEIQKKIREREEEARKKTEAEDNFIAQENQQYQLEKRRQKKQKQMQQQQMQQQQMQQQQMQQQQMQQ